MQSPPNRSIFLDIPIMVGSIRHITPTLARATVRSIVSILPVVFYSIKPLTFLTIIRVSLPIH